MKHTQSSQPQPTASPRFPRGLELTLWVTGVVLLTYGLNHIHWKTNAMVTDSATASLPSALALQNLEKQERSKPEWVHVETPQEKLLKNYIMAIELEGNMDKREGLIEAFVDSVVLSDIQSVLVDLVIEEKFKSHGVVDAISQRLIRRWAKYDAIAASAWVQELPSGSLKQDALSGVAVEWSNTSLSKAIEWGQQLPEPTEKEAVFFAVANEAVRTDPIIALHIAAQLPAGDQRMDLIQRSVREWAASDGEQAVTWAHQIKDEKLRGQVLASISIAISENDPVAAATLAATEISSGRNQSDAVVSIVERWGQQQPEQAAAWVERFPASELKKVALANVAQMWALTDSQKAEAWQNQMLADH